MGPLMAVTILFVISINRKHTLVTKHLPTHDCIIVDRIHEMAWTTTFFCPWQYLQPPSSNASRTRKYDEE
jgi:hypothetical protein